MALRKSNRIPHKRQSKKRNLWNRLRQVRLRSWITLLIIIGMLYLFLYGGNGIFHSIGLNWEIGRTEDGNDSLQAINDWKRNRIEKLEDGDKRALEEEAREKNLAYPDEIIVRIVEEDEK